MSRTSTAMQEKNVDWRAQGNLTNPGLCETESNKRREHAASRHSESSPYVTHGWALPLPCCGASDLPYVVYPTHCHARLGEQYNCDSIQVTINGATSRCQWACHQCLLNTLASYVFWSPPIVVHHWGCGLASLHRGSCNPWCPRAPKPYVHLPAQRKALGSLREEGSHSSGLREALNAQPGTPCKTHRSCWEVRWWPTTRYGQQYPDVKGLQPAAIRRPAMRLDMAVFAWEHMMHEQAATHWNVYIAMFLREDRRDSHWRQPWTPVSVTLGTEMADQKSLHWACNRHISMVGLFLLLVWQNQHLLLSLSAGFIPCHSGITWVSSMIFSEPSGSICVASSAITWVNLPTVGG